MYEVIIHLNDLPVLQKTTAYTDYRVMISGLFIKSWCDLLALSQLVNCQLSRSVGQRRGDAAAPLRFGWYWAKYRTSNGS